MSIWTQAVQLQEPQKLEQIYSSAPYISKRSYSCISTELITHYIAKSISKRNLDYSLKCAFKFDHDLNHFDSVGAASLSSRSRSNQVTQVSILTVNCDPVPPNMSLSYFKKICPLCKWLFWMYVWLPPSQWWKRQSAEEIIYSFSINTNGTDDI